MSRSVVWGVAVAGLVVGGCTRPSDEPAAATTTPPTSLAASTTTSTTTPAPTTSTTVPATSTTTTTTTPATTTSTTVPATSTTTTSTTVPATSTTTTTPVVPVSAGNNQPRTGRTWIDRPASDIAAPPLPDGWTVESIGTSHEGRSIDALRRPVDEPGRVVVVVGGIHGNEPVSPPIVRSLVEVDLPDDMEAWLIPELNPDGVARGTRANARGVDLNRNFPWRWDGYDGGPGPLSEAETAAIAALIEDLLPDVVVWVHQPLAYVSSIGATPDAYERAWSRGSGDPVRPDVTQHGGGESWTAFVAGVPSMLIEADTYEATEAMVAAHRNGFRELVAAMG